MKTRKFGLMASLLLLATPFSGAQDKPKPDVRGPGSALKLQVTIVEREGEKKLTSLPYTFFVKAEEGHGGPWTKLRTGSRVPVYVGRDAGMQYIEVGTNIDARVAGAEDGRFDLVLNLERSWVEGDAMVRVAGEPNPGQYKEPIIRQFKTELTLPMRDGQTTESTQAADPGNGRVLTITVTMNVVK